MDIRAAIHVTEWAPRVRQAGPCLTLECVWGHGAHNDRLGRVHGTGTFNRARHPTRPGCWVLMAVRERTAVPVTSTLCPNPLLARQWINLQQCVNRTA